MSWIRIIENEENKNGVILRNEANNSVKYETIHVVKKDTWLEVNDVINKNWVKVNYFAETSKTGSKSILYEKLVLYLPLVIKGIKLAKLEKDILNICKITFQPPTPPLLVLEKTNLTTENMNKFMENNFVPKIIESDLVSESNVSTVLEFSQEKNEILDRWIKNNMILDSLCISSYQNILERFKETKPENINTKEITSYLKQNFELKKINGKINYKGIGLREKNTVKEEVKEEIKKEEEKEIIIIEEVKEEEREEVKEEVKEIKKIYKKKVIPKQVKILCWNLYIGEDKTNSKCVCCNSTTINITNFHCGHVLAEVNGGETNINNLRPICSGCNLSMGSMNMDDFIKMIRINFVEEDLLK
jgi:hypothetical protein